MKKTDWIFIFFFLLILSIFVIPYTRNGFENLTENYPYIMGFIKTSILATYGELLASRLLTGNYFSRKGILPRFIIWGILGMGFVLMFKIFSAGVVGAIDANVLPDITNQGFLRNLYIAFMTSLIMNLIFAPTFMILHRITDTFIDLRNEGKKNVKTNQIIGRIDWNNFFGFVIFKTIPIFWIPAHTITFLLPDNYRVLMAGFLSIALGLILTFTKMKNRKEETYEELS